MLEQTTIKVGDDEFVLQQFSTTVGLRYAVQVGRIFGTMIAGGFEGVEIVEGKDIAEQLDITKMITGLLSQLHDERTPELIKSMLKDAIKTYQVKGVTKTAWDNAWYETRFAGKLGGLTELLMVVLMDNFGDVMEVAQKKFTAALPPTPPKSSEHGTGQNGKSPADPQVFIDFFSGL